LSLKNQTDTPPQKAAETDRRWLMFQRACALGQLLLILATHKLWWGNHAFPAVPMAMFPDAVASMQPWIVVSLVLSLACIVFQSQPKQALFVIVLIAWLALFVTNQHRLQPWAYQAALWNLAFATLTARAARLWLSALTISIYVYSSCGKFDFQFLHTVGQEFLSAFLAPPDETIPVSRLVLAAILPAAELATAIGLIVPKTRRVAGIAAMLMHASLVILLGPWLKSHSWGVVVWNLLLIPHAWFLFVAPVQSSANSLSGNVKRSFMTPLCFTLMLLLPLSERFGYWDHWLSWSLYSPHTSRVEMEVHETVVDRLPDTLGPLLDDTDGDHWHSVPLEIWSLDDLGTPIYPQARFQLGVAAELAVKNELGDGVRVKVRSVANRWTGARTEEWISGEQALISATKNYWLLPRSFD
jgi:hypothetical protein